MPLQRKRPLQRRAATLEDRLWQRLRALNAQGRAFRRNGTHKTFRLAFVDHAALVVIDIDDAPPGSPATRHAVRDRLLREAGYFILRIRRAEAGRDLNTVMSTLRAVLEDSTG